MKTIAGIFAMTFFFALPGVAAYVLFSVPGVALILGGLTLAMVLAGTAAVILRRQLGPSMDYTKTVVLPTAGSTGITRQAA